MRDRRAEDPDHCIADELLNRPAEERELASHQVVVDRQSAAYFLDVEVLAHACEPGQIGEQRGHHLAFLLLGELGEQRPTTRAEPRLLGSRIVTYGANAHGDSLRAGRRRRSNDAEYRTADANSHRESEQEVAPSAQKPPAALDTVQVDVTNTAALPVYPPAQAVEQVVIRGLARLTARCTSAFRRCDRRPATALGGRGRRICAAGGHLPHHVDEQDGIDGIAQVGAKHQTDPATHAVHDVVDLQLEGRAGTRDGDHDTESTGFVANRRIPHL